MKLISSSEGREFNINPAVKLRGAEAFGTRGRGAVTGRPVGVPHSMGLIMDAALGCVSADSFQFWTFS